MNKDAIFDKIEAWLSGELPESEAGAFESEIAGDTTLAAEVERHRRGREALDRLSEKAIQTDMARWRESLDELPEPPLDIAPPPGMDSWSRRIIGSVVGFLLLVAVYWLWPSKEVQPNNPPTQQSLPPQIQTTVPIAVTPSDGPVNENPDTKQTEGKNSPQLIAMAQANLNDLRGAILQQYGQTMGDDDEENPLFTAGVKAFKQNDLKAAKKDLLQVLKTDPYFPSAQEILASIYLSEKNYPKAVQCYEFYARQSADPVADWRLLQFYLSDYQHHKTEFSKNLNEIANPDNHHRFQKEAEKLKHDLSNH